LERHQEALDVFMTGGPIRGKALRGINEGGVRCVYDRWAHMRRNASQ